MAENQGEDKPDMHILLHDSFWGGKATLKKEGNIPNINTKM
jgi:hypothetical protein